MAGVFTDVLAVLVVLVVVVEAAERANSLGACYDIRT